MVAMRNFLRLISSGLFLMVLATSVRADFVTYQLNGEIPAGALLGDPNVTIGESWTANLVVDTSTPLSNPGETSAGYEDAVVSGSLEFSGGYIPDIDFSGFDVLVFNDTAFGFDAISFGTDIASGIATGSVFQSLSANDGFSSLSLPGIGASLTPVQPTTDVAFAQLTLVTRNGAVQYTSADSNNVTFVAIPEPLVAPLIGLASLGICRRRNRTK